MDILSSNALYNYLFFWVCILGLCLGSFYNVVILRSLSGESIVFPPSKCPKCNHNLYPWHNIPVLSYIFLRGRCYFCKEKISIQYPIIELVTGFLFALSFYKFGISFQTLFAMIFVSALLIMTVTDLKEKLVDCNIAIGLAVVGLVYNYFVNNTLVDALVGMVVGVLVLEIVARLGYLFTKSRAMGEADTYVAGALGACFGFSNLGYVLLYSLIGSMIFLIPVFLYNQIKRKHYWMSLVFVLFLISTFAYKLGFENLYILALVMIFGITTAIMVLKSLKTDPCPIYLPFVPAFSIGALYFLFSI